MVNRINKVGRPKAGERDVYWTLVEATEHLIIETEIPLEKITIRMISNKAGVSSSLIRYYFGCKDELVEVVIDKLVSNLFNHIKGILINSVSIDFTDAVGRAFREITNLKKVPEILYKISKLDPRDSKREFFSRSIVNYTRCLSSTIC